MVLVHLYVLYLYFKNEVNQVLVFVQLLLVLILTGLISMKTSQNFPNVYYSGISQEQLSVIQRQEYYRFILSIGLLVVSISIMEFFYIYKTIQGVKR